MENLPYLVIEGMITGWPGDGRAARAFSIIRHEYEEPQRNSAGRDRPLLPRGILGNKHPGQRSRVRPGNLRQPRRVHLRRRKRAARSHRRQARRAPQQASLPGHERLMEQADRDQQRGDLHLATAILVRGVDWYKAQGKNGSPGMKFVGISGDVVRPGVFEVPMGTTYSELIFDYAGGISGGKQAAGLRASGPSSGYLPASMADLPLDFERGGRGRIDGWFGRDRGLRRRPLHAGHGAECGALLPQ